MSQGHTIFAFAAFRPCGCVCIVTTPEALADTMKNKFFREEMNAGRVKTLLTREEFNSIPWKCGVCRPEKQKELFEE